MILRVGPEDPDASSASEARPSGEVLTGKSKTPTTFQRSRCRPTRPDAGLPRRRLVASIRRRRPCQPSVTYSSGSSRSSASKAAWRSSSVGSASGSSSPFEGRDRPAAGWVVAWTFTKARMLTCV
jgi:hypothetical protein